MNEQLLPLLGIALLVLVIGGILIWRILGRLTKPGFVRTLLRLAALVGLVALVGFVIFSVQNTQAEAAAAEVPTPVETLVVTAGNMAVTLDATGSLAANSETVLTFETSAPVSEVLVKAGDFVRAGDVLARLETTDAELTLQNAEVALTDAQAALDALLTDPRDIDIQVAEASVNAAQASVNAAAQGPTSYDIEIARLDYELAKNSLWQTQLNRDATLATNPEFRGLSAYAQEVELNSQVFQSDYNVFITESSYQDLLDDGPDQGSLSSAYAKLVAAKADLDDLIGDPDATELRQAQIDLETAKLDVKVAQKDLTDTTLVAPFDGLVAVENLMVGAYPPEDDAITLIDINNFTIELQVDETDVLDVAVGQSVTLDLDALPDTLITGTVTRVDTVAIEDDSQLVTYGVEVTLNATDVPLRSGMSAVATIVLAELENVITVPNRFIDSNDMLGDVVLVQTDAVTYLPAPITIGLRNDSVSQIVDGLSVGQTVVIMPETDADTEGGFFPMPGMGGGGSPGGGGGPGGGGPPPG